MATSFTQFSFCSLCRLNHKRKDHVYSKRHQDVIKHILIKFGKKVKEARKLIPSPQIESMQFEVGAKFWCYFCAVEVERHTRVETATVKWEGLIQHLTLDDHKKATNAFWYDNHIDQKKKNKFILESDRLKDFQVAAEKAVRVYLAKEKEKIGKIAHQLAQQQKKRQHLVHYQRHLQAMSQVSESKVGSSRSSSSSYTPEGTSGGTSGGPTGGTSGGMRTTFASGEGLACITLKDTGEGNVYSGAQPPWLVDDKEEEETEQNTEIGPSLSDWQKHLASEEKRKLPATRVGAKFDHKQYTSEDWLPSFGRVWNSSRRQHSRQQFMKSHQFKKTYTERSNNNGKVYNREKPFPTATVTSSEDEGYNLAKHTPLTGPIPEYTPQGSALHAIGYQKRVPTPTGHYPIEGSYNHIQTFSQSAHNHSQITNQNQSQVFGSKACNLLPRDPMLWNEGQMYSDFNQEEFPSNMAGLYQISESSSTNPTVNKANWTTAMSGPVNSYKRKRSIEAFDRNQKIRSEASNRDSNQRNNKSSVLQLLQEGRIAVSSSLLTKQNPKK